MKLHAVEPAGAYRPLVVNTDSTVMLRDAAQIKMILTDPNSNEATTTVLPIALSAGESTETSYSFTAPSALGIYYVDYALLDDDGRVVQPRTEGARAAVARFR